MRARERVESKNSLENYAYSMKNTASDDQTGSKLAPEDKQKILDACEDAIKWLDSAQEASKEEYDDKQKEVEAVCTPIITRMYQDAAGGDADVGGGDAPDAGGAAGGPAVEEVD